VGFNAGERLLFVEYLLRNGGNIRQMSDQRCDIELYALRLG
jgi:hypothetical protein